MGMMELMARASATPEGKRLIERQHRLDEAIARREAAYEERLRRAGLEPINPSGADTSRDRLQLAIDRAQQEIELLALEGADKPIRVRRLQQDIEHAKREIEVAEYSKGMSLPGLLMGRPME